MCVCVCVCVHVCVCMGVCVCVICVHFQGCRRVEGCNECFIFRFECELVVVCFVVLGEEGRGQNFPGSCLF